LSHCSLDKGRDNNFRLKKFPGNSAPITAIAQHHGIPTFLLDWTENPWIAAFFASDSPEEFKDEHDICVWGLNINKVEGGMGEIARLNNLGAIRVNRPPKSKNIYLSSQAGLMTYLSDGRGIWRNTGSYPGFEEIISRWTSEVLQTEGFYSQFPEHIENQKSAIKTYFSEEVPIIRKVVLAKEHLPTLRKLLRLEGITRAQLMPTYDNLTETSLSFAKMNTLNLGRT
jgi:FRG domain